jgi:4-amino-4-deoxy-L-arabinose transferase-like glycosyltransferase
MIDLSQYRKLSMSHQRSVPKRLIVLFLVFWVLWTARLGAKFYGEQDSYRTWIPAAVRNYDIYDYDDIGFMIVRDTYIEDVENLHVYSHHPPLNVWLPALFAKVAGLNEVSVRFVFVASMMIAAVAFYAMVKQLYDERLAFWAVFFFGITPMIAYFQMSYGHDPLGFMAFCLFGAIYTHWLKRPTRLRFIGLIATTILATWSAWPAVLFVGMFGICGLFFVGWRQRTEIVVLGIVAVVSVATMLFLYESWWVGSFESLMEAYVWRSSTVSYTPGSEPFTANQWISVNFMHVVTFGSIGLLALAFIGTIFLFKRGTHYANTLTLSMLLAALAYFLLFRNATYIHHYYKAYLIPSLAIAAAATVVYTRKIRPRALRPVADGLIIACVVQSIYILLPLVATTHEPSLTNIVNYINGLQTQPDLIIVRFPTVNPGSDHAIEYYTMHRIQWGVRLNQLPENIEGLYIYCAENQQYVVDHYGGSPPPSTPLDELCTAYDLAASSP